jgi:hypothetical protein
MVQHKAVVAPNEVACQGYCCHAVTTYDCIGLSPGGRRAPQRDVAQVRKERRPPSHTPRAQGHGKDQVKPRQGPHAHTTSTQLKAVATIQGG